MRRFISLLTVLLIALMAVAQTKSIQPASAVKQADTIFARYSMCGTIRGDTVMFDDGSGRGASMTRYFNRQFRCVEEGDSLATGFFKFFLLIDKEGHVTKVWCDAATPQSINKEITRVVMRMGKFKPGNVKGKYVATVVETRILFVADGQEIEKWNYYDIDLTVNCSPVCIKPARQPVKKD
jgi:hypothetical protein